MCEVLDLNPVPSKVKKKQNIISFVKKDTHTHTHIYMQKILRICIRLSLTISGQYENESFLKKGHRSHALGGIYLVLFLLT